MDAVVEDKDVLFADVFKHLGDVEAKPATALLDEDLLRRAGRALDPSTPRELLWRLLSTGEQLLQILQQDPRPLTRVLEQTVLLIPFDELRTAISAEKLIEGLNSPSIPVQLLCLAYLKKAADLPSGASFVAADSNLTKTLVTVWLSSESTEVAERSLEVLIALLAVDSPGSITVISTRSGTDHAEGQGLMWRRIFQDPEVYSLLLIWTSLIKSNYNIETKKGLHAATISQARLFDFIAQVAPLDWVAITTSIHPSVEREYSKTYSDAEQPYGGLLKYAASGMIDPTDYLMEVLRQDFFGKLLMVVEEEGNKSGVSPKMIRAIQDGAGVQGTEQNGSNGMHI